MVTRSNINMYILFIIIVIVIANGVLCVEEGALIRSVPGFEGSKLPSKHYSGYVSLEKEEKKLFYYFVESERDPTKDAVVLWLNGGPGCSSLDGFVFEHGPFNFEAGKPKGSLPKLHLNPYSWSKVSNIIYLDSPAGVGYSYSPNPKKYVTGDIQTAKDTHAFLLRWFEKYPEFVKNPFYIAGESYAGVYVPTLASDVVKGIKSGAKPNINFKGYMIGNGVADDKFDSNALVPFAHGMALISDAIYKDLEAACKGKYYDFYKNDKCDQSINKLLKALDGLNIYDILAPCYHGESESDKNRTTTSDLPDSFKQLGRNSSRPLGVRKRMFGRAWPFRAPVKDGPITLWPQILASFHNNNGGPECVNDAVATRWLNDEAVRKALHAQPEEIAGAWELCSDRILYNSDVGSSMIPYHTKLTSEGYRALIYSGDHDMCVPFTGTQAWTESLRYKVIDEWRSWYSNSQVAGYLQGYDHNLTFLTVKGAGHTVPEYKPRESLKFYSHWLDGKPI